MKILQLVLRHCAASGFGPSQSTTQKYPINRKNVQALSFLCFAFGCSCAYFFLDANTFEEYTSSVYVSMSLMLIIAIYCTFIWKNQQTCELFNSFEKIVNDSESDFTHSIHSLDSSKTFHVISGLKYPASAENYVEINEQVEKWTKIIHFVYLKVNLHMIVIPKAILSFYLYFSMDAGRDAFELPYAVW